MIAKSNDENALLILSHDDYYGKWESIHYLIDYCSKTYPTTIIYYKLNEKHNSASDKDVDQTSKKIAITDFNTAYLEHLQKSGTPASLFLQITDLIVQPFHVLRVTKKYLKNQTHPVGIADGFRSGLTGVLFRKVGKISFLVYNDVDYHSHFSKNKIFRAFIGTFEQYILQNSNLVVCVNKPLFQVRKKQGIQNVFLVPHVTDCKLFEKAQLKIPHSPTIVFVGRLIDFEGIGFAIKSLPAVKKVIPNIRFLIIGSGPQQTELEKITSNLGLSESVVFKGYQDHQTIPNFLMESDLGIATFPTSDDRLKFSLGISLKMVEYMAAGLPVVVTKVGELGRMVDALKIGLAVGENEEDFARAVIKLLTDQKLYAEASKNAISYARLHDRDYVYNLEFQEISARRKSTR